MVRKFFYQLQKFHMNIKKTILQWSCGNPWSWLKPSNFLSRSSLYIECLEAQKLGIKKFNRENVVELLINLGECFMLQSHVRNLIWEKRVYRKVDCCFKQTPSIAFISRPSYMGCKLSLELPLGWEFNSLHCIMALLHSFHSPRPSPWGMCKSMLMRFCDLGQYPYSIPLQRTTIHYLLARNCFIKNSTFESNWTSGLLVVNVNGLCEGLGYLCQSSQLPPSLVHHLAEPCCAQIFMFLLLLLICKP